MSFILTIFLTTVIGNISSGVLFFKVDSKKECKELEKQVREDLKNTSFLIENSVCFKEQ